MRPYPTVIKDGFFDDPDQIRQFALAQELLDVKAHNARYGARETWPGLRSAALGSLNSAFEAGVINHLLANILRLPPSRWKANSSFQLTRAADGDSWIHRDDQRFDIAGLIYLTPNPPGNSGTAFYNGSPESGFAETDRVANRFNRVLLFDSQAWHKSCVYFGSSPADARLTLPFFIELEPEDTAAP